MDTKAITVETTVRALIGKVWSYWTEPEHIMAWNSASADWHTPRATNDLREGGRFDCRMESRDGEEGFDFTGVYTEIEPQALIEYSMDDGRKVSVAFEETADGVRIRETFDMESENPAEMQRAGWQSILDNFKRYVEAN